MRPPAAVQQRPRITRLADGACIAALILNWAAPVALAGATPFLLAHHDLLLEALSSSAVSIVTGGALARVGRAPLLLVLLAPLCGVALLDISLWWAGRRWGERLLRVYLARGPRGGRWLSRADRWVERHGVRTVAAAYFLPVPNAVLYLSCGAAGMALPAFVVGDVIGTLLWTGVLVAAGWAAGRHGVDVVNALNRDELKLSVLVLLVFVLVGAARRCRRR